MLTANDVINRLNPRINELRMMKVQRLSIFGSVARGDSHSSSDVDFLVEFSVPVTFDLFFDLKHFLEDLLEGPIDLVTFTSLKPALKPFVEQDLIDVV